MARTILAYARRTALFTVGLLVVVTVADYVVGVNSDAMTFARARVTESAALKQDLGEITEVRLRPFWGFRNKSGFAIDRTELALRVEGTRAATDLHLTLEGKDDSWRILESSLPL
jgi:hypothetical protein